MPAKNLLRISAKGTYSHVYNKGIENRLIFKDKDDYEVFLKFISEYLSPQDSQTAAKTVFTVKGRTYKGTPHLPKNYFKKVELIAYSLASDHFHLVLHQLQKGSIESFLRSLSTRYSMYFNKKYQRQGSLFEGPYKSAHIESATAVVEFVAYLFQTHKDNRYTREGQEIAAKSNILETEEILESLFTNAENIPVQGETDFKSFAEKHTFTLEQENSLNKLMLEKKQQKLEGRDLSIVFPEDVVTPLKVPSFQTKRTLTRLPEYAGLLFIFAVLLTLGIRNVQITSISANANTSITVDNRNDSNNSHTEQLTIETQIKEKDEVLSATVSATEAMTEATEPFSLLFTPIEIMEGYKVVNIYSAPSLSSAVHRTAKEGEFLDGAPIDLDWYEVTLDENTRGFIQSEYVKLRQEILE